MTLLGELAAELDASDVMYCVWKSQHKLRYVADGSEDLDLLVSPRDYASAARALAALGFRRIEPRWDTKDIGTEMVVGLTEEGQVLKLHLHTRILFGNSIGRDYGMPIEAEVLARRVRNDESQLWVADPYSDACLFLTRHIVRTRGGRPVNFLPEWRELFDFHRLDEVLADWRDVWFPVAEIGEVVGSKDVTEAELRLIRRKVKTQLRAFRRESPRLRRPLVFLVLSCRAVLKRLGLSRGRAPALAMGGFIVPLVGIDGAGKSSALERLSESLGSSLPVETVFLGSGQSGASLLRRAAFLLLGTKARFSGHAGARDRSEASKTGDRQRAHPWYYQIWLLLCLHDKHRNLRKGMAAAAEGRIVLADRWPQASDPYAADGARTEDMKIQSPLDRFTRRFEQRLLRDVESVRVPLLFLLDVSPEVSVERKPEDLTLEQAEAGRGRLKAITWNADVVEVVDAEAPIDVIDAQLIAAIRRVLAPA